MESQQSNAPREGALIRALGPVMLTAAVINVIVGGGIFRLPSELSSELGAASPTAFLLGALLILPVTLCFAAVGSRVISTGGPYSYLHTAFGPLPGFLTGALMWLGNVSSSAGIAVALMALLTLLWPDLSAGTTRIVGFCLLYGLLAGLNLRGVALGGRVLVALATLKLMPLIILVLLGLFFVDLGQIHWLAIPSMAALSGAMINVMFAYSGIETALIPSGEVRDPARDVPRAAFAATLLVVLLYVGIQVVCQAALGPALINNPTPVASAAGALWAPGKWLIVVTAGISMFGFMMGNVLGSARVVYALGRDGFLPRQLGEISGRGVPHFAIMAHTGFALLLASFGNFSFLILVSSGSNCLIYVMVALAAWQLQRRDVRPTQMPERAPYLLPMGAALIPGFCVLAMVWVLSSLKREEWFAIVSAMAVLITIYAGLRWLRRKEPLV